MGYLTFAQVEEVRLRRILKLIIIENKVRSFFTFSFIQGRSVLNFSETTLKFSNFFNDLCVIYWLPCGKEWCSVLGYNKISVNR